MMGMDAFTRPEVEDMHKAVPTRRSIRAFNGVMPEDGRIMALHDVVSRLTGPCRVVHVQRSTGNEFLGMAIRGYTGYLAMVGDTEREDCAMATGFAGELAVLAATSLGLGTCCVSATLRREAIGAAVGLRPGERVMAASPLGYAGRDSMANKVLSAMVKSGSRLPMERLLMPSEAHNGPTPAWVSAGLEAARLAPSAGNRQPWLFAMTREGTVKVHANEKSRDMGPDCPKPLDCGIAMLHFALGAAMAGSPGDWRATGAPAIAEFKPR